MWRLGGRAARLGRGQARRRAQGQSETCWRGRRDHGTLQPRPVASSSGFRRLRPRTVPGLQLSGAPRTRAPTQPMAIRPNAHDAGAWRGAQPGSDILGRWGVKCQVAGLASDRQGRRQHRRLGHQPWRLGASGGRWLFCAPGAHRGPDESAATARCCATHALGPMHGARCMTHDAGRMTFDGRQWRQRQVEARAGSARGAGDTNVLPALAGGGGWGRRRARVLRPPRHSAAACSAPQIPGFPARFGATVRRRPGTGLGPWLGTVSGTRRALLGSARHLP